MKISPLNPELDKYLASIDPEMTIWKCHQCGQCSSICPSYRNGGIRTREVVEQTLLGTIDPGEEESIWLCTMCNSCTERCQLGVDPASIIATLRNLAALEGKAPSHFKEEARLFRETGISFPITGLTRKLRKELGLDQLEVGEATKEEIRTLIVKTGLGRIDLG